MHTCRRFAAACGLARQVAVAALPLQRIGFQWAAATTAAAETGQRRSDILTCRLISTRRPPTELMPSARFGPVINARADFGRLAPSFAGKTASKRSADVDPLRLLEKDDYDGFDAVRQWEMTRLNVADDV